LLISIRLCLHAQNGKTTEQRQGKHCCLEIGHCISLPLREIIVATSALYA
jgi:hypothetical protein